MKMLYLNMYIKKLIGYQNVAMRTLADIIIVRPVLTASGGYNNLWRKWKYKK